MEALWRSDQVGSHRTTFLTTILSTLVEAAPTSGLIPELLSRLLSGAAHGTTRTGGAIASWGPDLDGLKRDSPAHTGRSVVALGRVAEHIDKGRLAVGPPVTDEVKRAVEAGITWLCSDGVSLDHTQEQLRRPLASGMTDVLLTGHFTAAWVARAVMSAPLNDERERRLRAAVAAVSASRDGELWRWTDGTNPIWMTYQGMVTLRDYGMRCLPWPARLL